MAIPLCAILVLAYLLRPQWRHGLIYPTAVLVVFTMVATVLAADSGEKLEETLSASDRRSPLLHKHTELGDQVKWLMIAFGIVALAFLALTWYRERTAHASGHPTWTSRLGGAILALGVCAAVLGGVATVWDVRAGHAGAKSVWSDQGGDNAYVPPQGSDGG
jgi:hypothetical protein